MEVALYVRVSTKRQVEEGYSLEAQKDKLIKLCKNNNYNIFKIYVEEGKSGKNTDRPAFQEMMNDMRLGCFEKIIVTKIDRISRSILDLEKLINEIQKNNCSFETLSEKIDLSSSIGVLFIRLLGIFAQFERERITERINDTFEKMVDDGKAISGSQPLGYKIENSKVVINEDTISIAKDIFNFYELSNSIGSVKRKIKAKYNLDISNHTIRNTLKNHLYIGEYRSNKNYCPALIEKERFLKINEILNTRGVKCVATDRIYLFSNLIVDINCGCKMCGIANKYNTQYYRCNKARHNKCKSFGNVSEKYIEQFLLSTIEDKFKKTLEELKITYKRNQKKDYNIKINELKQERERLNILFQKGRIEEKYYEKEYSTIEKKIEKYSNQASKQKIKKMENLLCDNWKEVYFSLNKEDKRSFWRSFIKAIELNPNNYKEENINIIFL